MNPQLVMHPAIRDNIMREAEKRGILQRYRAKQAQQESAGQYSPFYRETPLPAQLKFIESRKRRILFGGQVGGGKSLAMLMRAARGVHDPQYEYLILRKTMADMLKPNGILDLAKKMFKQTAVWVEKESAMIFPSGAKIVFGPCENLRDAQNRYQGPAFTGGIGIDEAGLMKWDVIQWLGTRIRGPKGVSWRPSLDLTANPGGLCHDELVEHFGLLEGTECRDDYQYIPASLYDNPFIDAAEYELQFKDLAPHVRQALLEGSWAVKVPGVYFSEDQFIWVDPREVPAFWTWVRVWDIGVTGKKDPTASLRAAFDESTGIEWHEGHTMALLTANQAQKAIIAQAQSDGPGTVVVIEEDNVSRSIVQGLVADHGWLELDYKDPDVSAKFAAARSKGQFSIMTVKMRGGKVERAEHGIGQIHDGRHRIVRSKGADAHVTQLTRMTGAKDEHDEALDLIGMAWKATRKIGTPRLSEVEDTSSRFIQTQSEVEAKQFAESERLRLNRLRKRG